MVEKSQIATTIEQSKRLLRAGIDPESADMTWINAFIGPNRSPSRAALLDVTTVRAERDVPAWSLSKLWDICNDSGIGPFNFGGNDFDSSSLIEKLVNWIILGVFDCEVIDEYLNAETIQELNHNVAH